MLAVLAARNFAPLLSHNQESGVNRRGVSFSGPSSLPSGSGLPALSPGKRTSFLALWLLIDMRLLRPPRASENGVETSVGPWHLLYEAAHVCLPATTASLKLGDCLVS